jgi:histidyl-tRNA synthetase
MPRPKKSSPQTKNPAKKPVIKKKPSAKDAEAKPKKALQPLQSVRGMRDILPLDQTYWNQVRKKAGALASDYGFERIDTPMIEDTNLFVRGVGKATDIVEKELYTFETKGGEQVSLRPEGTAPVVRAYIQHGMLNLPQPQKLWYLGPMFRYDRPQSGRYRQFYQVGYECIGDDDPVVDAQLIIIGWNFLKELGIDAEVKVNSLGTMDSRANYRDALVAYFRTKRAKLSEEDKKRLLKNPLRLLDSKSPEIQELKAEAPQIADWLDEDSKNRFMRVLEYLDEVGVPYQFDPYLVRGLDYYERTVFEFYTTGDEGDAAQSALGGGGRYDPLIPMLGGRQETPGAGMSLGLDRVVSKLREKDKLDDQPRTYELEPCDIFLTQLGDKGRKRALSLFEEFRKEGLPVAEAFSKENIKAQMEIANRRQAKWAIVIGHKEVLDGTAIIRDMDAGTQEIVDIKKVISSMKRKVEGLKSSENGTEPNN